MQDLSPLATARSNGRRSNLELYRVIVMLLIIAHHYVVNSGLMDVMREQPLSGNSLFLYVLGMWGKIGINCFVLITGYFMYKSKITYRKFLKLLLEVEFYKIFIYLTFTLSGYKEFSCCDFLITLIPITMIDTNFPSCFLVFYLCIPFLNILIRNLTKREHFLLISLCLFIYTFLGTIPIFHVTMNYVSWFSVLYFISSYISKYNVFFSVSHRKWGYLTLLSVLISIFSVVFILALPILFHIPYLYPYRSVADSNALLALITAICSFMYFKDLKIKQSSFINMLGASTFGVLLIHANSDTMLQWLWKDTLNNVSFYASDYMIIHVFLSVIIVFAICIAIDYIRICCFENRILQYADKILAKYHID